MNQEVQLWQLFIEVVSERFDARCMAQIQAMKQQSITPLVEVLLLTETAR